MAAVRAAGTVTFLEKSMPWMTLNSLAIDGTQLLFNFHGPEISPTSVFQRIVSTIVRAL